jgi:ABC transporter substrate binding protein (PQQ-dependent alcohol dehydrogenase system)
VTANHEHGRRIPGVAWALLGALVCGRARAEAGPVNESLTPVPIVYLSRDDTDISRGSLTDPVVADYGWQGARFALEEVNVNGRFLGKQYQLIKVSVPAGGDLQAAAKQVLADRHFLIVADLDVADLLSVADLPQASEAVILDARTSDDALRQADCRDNVFHLLPDWAMRADALGQFLARKNWKRWLLLRGVTAADQSYATAVRRAASRVGAKIVAEQSFQYQADAARAAGGHEQIQSQLAAVTRTSAVYDVLFAADTSDAFGDYLLYNTWDPRPVVGTHGLVAVAWHPLFREYAARGVEYRFHLAASRDMTERDYGNWLAVSTIGEAVTRSGKTGAADVRSYLLSDQFSVPANKGEGLSFRRWDHQMRQPVLLFGSQMLVSMWPQGDSAQAKFQTDVLGYSQQESACRRIH